MNCSILEKISFENSLAIFNYFYTCTSFRSGAYTILRCKKFTSRIKPLTRCWTYLFATNIYNCYPQHSAAINLLFLQLSQLSIFYLSGQNKIWCWTSNRYDQVAYDHYLCSKSNAIVFGCQTFRLIACIVYSQKASVHKRVWHLT